jgi:magnesium transporter
MLTTIAWENSPIVWIDACSPSPVEIDEVSAKFNLDSYIVRDSMNPEHFPRFDKLSENVHYLILRIYDNEASEQADTVRELTRKVALFYGPNFIFTIHRKEIGWINDFSQKIKEFSQKKNSIEALVTKIIQEAIHQYDKPIQAGNRTLERFEQKIFNEKKAGRLMEELYFNRRKAAVYREMLDLISDLLTDSLFFNPAFGRNQSTLKNLKSECQRLHFYSSKLYESISNLIHLHLALASHRTNEVMRILTVFSAFFLPLTFVVGIYGMNFRYIPELEQHYGYHAVWAVMILICLTIFIWFRRRGFL